MGGDTFCGPEACKILGAVLRKREYKSYEYKARHEIEYFFFFFSLFFHWLYIPGWDLTLSLNFVLLMFLLRRGL